MYGVTYWKNTPYLDINCETLQFKLKKNIVKTQIILKSEKVNLIFVKIAIKKTPKTESIGADN